jgi:programmed cell death 6-interacting protein
MPNAARSLTTPQSFAKAIDTNFSRAQKDNDLIYHQNVPPESTLEPIAAVNMVNSVIDNKLKDPSLAIGNTDSALFAGLVSHGVRMAIGACCHDSTLLGVKTC